MEKKYLKLFVDCLEKYRKLNDAEFGRLIRAALSYTATGVEVELMGREELLWDGMKLDIDRANKKYDDVCAIRSEAGKKGAETRWQTHSKNSKSHLPYSKNGQEEEKEEEKEKEKEKEIKKKDASASGAIRYDQYRSAFIEECPSLPKPSETGKWTAARKQAIRAKGMTPEEMRTVFAKVQRSDFLSGRSGRWSGCSLDWILKPANWQKIREGNYDNKGSQRARSAPTYDLGALDEMDLTKL